MKINSPSDPFIVELITGLGLGGAERLAAELTREIACQGRNIRLVAIDNDARILEQYPELVTHTTVLGVTWNPMTAIRAFVRLNMLIRAHRHVVIHAHMFHALLAAVLLKILKPSLAIIFTSHSYGGFNRLRKQIVKITKKFRAADVIFAADQHVEMNASNTLIIPNFAPRFSASDSSRSRLRDSARPITFAFIGRMIPTKNPLAIIRSFQELDSDSARLLLVGGGPLEATAAALVKEHGLGERVTILGPRNDIQTILSEVDCLVMASDWEGLPMIILEAGSRGIPVIAPPVGAIPQLLGDGCGYLCAPSELPKVMKHIVEYPAEAADCGVKLKQKINDQYSIESATALHLAVYDTAHARDDQAGTGK